MRRLLGALAALLLLAPAAHAQFDGGPGSRPHAGLGRFNRLSSNLAVPPRTHFQKQSNATIANNTFAVYSWVSGEKIVDEVGSWSSGSPTKFFAPTGYTRAKILVYSFWGANNTGFRWIGIQLTGANVQWVESVANNETGLVSQTKWLTGLTPSDYIEFQFAQTSGGNLNLQGASGTNAYATNIEILWAP